MQAQDQKAMILHLPLFKRSLAIAPAALLFISIHSIVNFSPIAFAQTTNSGEYSPEAVKELVDLARSSGDSQRGLSIYTRAKAACFSCHKIGNAGGQIGPELTTIGKQRTPEQLAESLLWPNRNIAPEFQVHKIITSEGVVTSGYRDAASSSETQLGLRDPATGKITIISNDDIEQQSLSLSLMPNGLFQSFPLNEQADVLRFLIDLGTNEKLDLPAMEAQIRKASTHEPAIFPIANGPIHPEQRPAHREHVNRNRIYDFYSHQAAYFTQPGNRPPLLQEYPGLDGPGFGHWGNQNEDTWRSNHWNMVDVGSVVSNVCILPNKTIARAVNFRFGPELQYSACFNADTLGYDGLWQGGFVKFSDVRHGFMDGVRPVGTMMELPENAAPIAWQRPDGSKPKTRYQGFYRYQNKIAFSYRVDDIEYIDTITMKEGKLERIAAPKQSHPDKSMMHGGESQWPQTFETPITSGAGDGFVVDTISLPTDNPWNVPLFCGDHGFLSDGTGIVVTMHGDVWRVSNIVNSSKAKWRRIASGLHHPLGVVVHEDQIYVLGRNQITRLHDFNGDQEIDWYECFSNAFVTSPAGHDYICGLQRDAAGFFYTASGNQGIVRISPDGETAQVIATGFRNPDGIGLLPDGTITVPCSEGEWTPTSMICQVLPKTQGDPNQQTATRLPGIHSTEYETSPPPFYGYRGPRDNQQVELPLMYLPRGMDNSSGGQYYVSDRRMGPLNEQIVHSSFGAGTCMLILRDRVGSQWQGAAVQLPGEFRSGSHRIHANPKDGQLYVTGMSGWGSYTPDPGCFQRIRYTGKATQMPIGFHIHANGITINFNLPIDPSVATNVEKQFAQAWNYRYSPGYGSREYSISHHPMVGHDCLTIKSAHVLNDKKSLFLEIPEMQMCSQLHVRMQVDGGNAQEIMATVNAMDAPRNDLPGVTGTDVSLKLPHPMVRDLEWLKRSIPNPWRNAIAGAREIRIESRENLQFSTKVLSATAGEAIKLTFTNPDVVPHNWALIQRGSLEKIGDLTNRLVGEPDAYLRHYVPESGDVICYTDVVEPSGAFSIFFNAPKEPGRYPFLCTFPGHWMVMNGELVVDAPK